jgi:hypothetical protein
MVTVCAQPRRLRTATAPLAQHAGPGRAHTRPLPSLIGPPETIKVLDHPSLAGRKGTEQKRGRHNLTSDRGRTGSSDNSLRPVLCPVLIETQARFRHQRTPPTTSSARPRTIADIGNSSFHPPDGVARTGTVVAAAACSWEAGRFGAWDGVAFSRQADPSHCSIVTASPPLLVASARQMPGLVPEVNHRTEPSAMAALTPFGCSLRAAKTPLPFRLPVPQSGIGLFGGTEAKNHV